ncbi:hypothetical protein ATO6_18325 [Oceanicola sp. 22II-s10i]|uniref:cytochrome c3 family protein n=1 Tax=Oceanicola sp. 22II-s10i TaxID=1317116 RepID=UPI000B522599|nr:tetratricopeptide repeat protein [Oceanicola sp. 22II-s10i]OWU83410.1 hypothetical protein ATO6_18325 [Oceanicola sp. 22II-s10i]
MRHQLTAALVQVIMALAGTAATAQDAASGYVDDAECAACHVQIADSYANVAMSKSFYAADGAEVIEDFDAPPLHHATSGLSYDMSLVDGTYRFRQFRTLPDGSLSDVYEAEVDWILGSGNHARTYIVQHPDGTLTELPLAWYTQERGWGMPPGYEFANQPGLQRQAEFRCLACHNAVPDLSAVTDLPGYPQHYPEHMPEGIGCQRCHGPGARHVTLATSGTAAFAEIMGSITNPADLPAERRQEICYSCHLQPSVAVASPLRGDRGVFSFRPGEPLSDYVTPIDIVDGTRATEDRFDINHHPYRMEQSACFTESEGKIGCLTCHDPHVKVKPEDRAAHYRAACLTCHQTDAAGQVQVPPPAAHPQIDAAADCTTCHMPERRTNDVVHVTMTDHRIGRPPADPAKLIAAASKVPADVTEVMLFRDSGLSGNEGAIQQVMALISNAGLGAEYASDILERLLTSSNWNFAAPWVRLAESRLAQGAFAEALAAAERILAIDPENPTGRMAMAVANFRLGATDEGLDQLRAVVSDWPDFPVARMNLAIMLANTGALVEALEQARHVTVGRDTAWAAWRLIAQIESVRGNHDAAADAYLSALRAEPRRSELHPPLVEALIASGREGEVAPYAPR